VQVLDELRDNQKPLYGALSMSTFDIFLKREALTRIAAMLGMLVKRNQSFPPSFETGRWNQEAEPNRVDKA
jgi:hypothetical protein